MTRTTKHQSLIDQLEVLDSIDSRFENIRCVYPSLAGERKGCLSIIFTADDIAENKKVAIKFIDPEYLGDTYRLSAFDREPKILNRLINKRRCLKLVYNLKSFDWQIIMPDGSKSTLPVNYFVTEWLDEDVETYFLEQHYYDALVKLQIFRSAVLAVAAFHSEDINHRDLKYDNLRAYRDGNELVIVVIDFGTAAHKDMPIVTASTDYPDGAVGNQAFSAPEAFVGLASYRKVGTLTDIYALGALLYRLFNRELFDRARKRNPHFLPMLSFLSAKISPLNTYEEKVQEWANLMPPIKYALGSPPIESPGNTLPKSIEYIVSRVYREMTSFDYMDRTSDLQSVVLRIDSAIKVLKNHQLDQVKLKRNRCLRQKKKEKLQRRDLKLAEYINKKNPLVEKNVST